MKKVVIIMLSKKKGGLENNLVAYAHALSEIGFDVTAIVDPKADIIPTLATYSKISISTLKQRGNWDFFAKFKLIKRLRRIKPLFIFMIGNRAMRFVLPFKSYSTCIPITSNYSLAYLTKYDFSIAMTRDLKNKILAISKKHTSYLLPNPIVKPDVVTKIESSPLIIGSLGRFVEKKGFKTLLRSLYNLKLQSVPFEAIIAGEGEQQVEIERLISEYGLKQTVRLPGWMNQADFYSAIDIFVLPSYHEPFGNVVLEAFSCGKPSICTNSEGPSEIASNGYNAIIAPKKDAVALTSALKDVILKQDLRHQIASNALITYNKNYSQPNFQKNIKLIINQITDLKLKN